MSSPMSLQPHHQARLIDILHKANIEYQDIAHNTRLSLHPTHHAKQHATRLGLAVDVQRAVNCSPREISIKPLPLLDPTLSPTAPTRPYRACSDLHDRNDPRPVLKSAIPSPTAHNHLPPISADFPQSTSGITPLSSSLMSAPFLHGHHIPQRAPSSRFSVSPVDTIPQIRIPCLDTMVVDNDSDSADASIEIPATPVLGRGKLPDVPIDEDEFDWELDSSDMDVSPMSSESSNASSSIPATPNDMSPLVVGAKHAPPSVENRPMYGRMVWAMPHLIT